mmetsp:Transcript_32383/g.39407  ORF Transcript_32383/g.39407 Transcript_32383/m.39407 type:complete len:171 (-) Transcript_32383:40-552(-)
MSPMISLSPEAPSWPAGRHTMSMRSSTTTTATQMSGWCTSRTRRTALTVPRGTTPRSAVLAAKSPRHSLAVMNGAFIQMEVPRTVARLMGFHATKMADHFVTRNLFAICFATEVGFPKCRFVIFVSIMNWANTDGKWTDVGKEQIQGKNWATTDGKWTEYRQSTNPRRSL